MGKIKKKWLLVAMLVLVVSLAFVGCTKNTDNVPPKKPDLEDQLEDKADDTKDKVDDIAENVEDDLRDMTYDDIKVTPEEAFDQFMELYPDATINKFELDKELLEYEYVIEGYDLKHEYEVKINPVNSEIISNDLEAIEDDDEKGEITKDHLAKIDSIIGKAKQEDGSDSKLDEWNISIKKGTVIMEVEIGAAEYAYEMDTEELIEMDM